MLQIQNVSTPARETLKWLLFVLDRGMEREVCHDGDGVLELHKA